MTDYLRLAQERATSVPQEQDNPYLPLAREQQANQQNRARTVLEAALRDDPELAAERRRLSQTSGLAPDVVQRNLEELRAKEAARAVDLARMAQDSPVLYRQLVDPSFTTTAVDDLGTLGNLERSVGRAVNRAMQYATGRDGLARDLGGAAVDIGLGATAGVGEMIFNMAGTLNDLIGWQAGAQGMRRAANRSKQARDELGFQPESSTGQAVKSGLQSSGTNLAILPLGLSRALFTTANQAAAAVAGVMSAGVGADAYMRSREKGRTQVESLQYAIPEGVFEFVFERIPASKLFGDIAANTGLLRTIGRQTISEGWTEQVTTLAQDFNEWMNLNPSKTLGEFINERPEAAYQTFIATLVGVGVQTSTIRGINKIIERAGNQALTFERDLLQQQMQLAAASMLRTRSPEQFRAHIQHVVDANEGATSEIFVDAEVLNQLPQELLAQLPESVRTALPEALDANSTVAIPMADVLTVAPGTELEQILNDNARLRPNAPSRLEGELAAKMIEQDAARVLAQAADTAAWQQSTQTVQQTILGELNTAGRFTPDVNEAYATLQANFFSTMAARVGMTPEALYERYRLRVAARQPGAGGQVLNAGGSRRLFHGSKTPLQGLFRSSSASVNTTTFGDVQTERTGVFFSDNPEFARQYGDVSEYEVDVQNTAEITRDVILDFAETIDPFGPERDLFLLAKNSRSWGMFEGELGRRFVAYLQQQGFDGATFSEDLELEDGTNVEGNTTVVFDPTRIAPTGDVFNQPARQAVRRERPVSPAVAAAGDIGNARTIASSQQWRTNRDFKIALQEAVRAAAGSRNLREDTPENRAHITRQLLKEAREALVTNSNAIGWYDDKVTTALEVVATIHPELKTDEQAKFAFIWALAVTSNGVKVDKNFELAERSYTYWKNSDPDPAKRKLPVSGIGVGPTASKIHNGLRAYNTLLARWGFDRLRAFATTLQPNRDVVAAFGRKVSGEGMDTPVYGAGILGPKIGNGFFMNLYGEFGQLTMDRWWVRMWGRITGDLVVIDPKTIREQRDAFIALVDMIKADRQALRAVEQALREKVPGAKLNRGTPAATAKMIIKATAKEEVRQALVSILPATPEREAAAQAARGKLQDFVSIGDELRKAAKSYYRALDGQIEVPGGSRRRDMMRDIAQSVLAELQRDNPALTMADFQALMWYPEKTLYDAAGALEQDDDAEGYEDDEAPDYANAAVKLAREQGISDAEITAAVGRARSDIEARQLAGRSGRGAVGVPGPSGAGAGADTGGTLAQGARRPGDQQDGAGVGRGAGRVLAPLEGAPTVRGAAGPDPRLVAVAEQYARDNGIALGRQSEYAKVDPERAARIAAAYEAMPHAPQDPAVREAYDDLARQTMAQYQALVAAGYRFWFMDPAADPYQGNPWNAMRDLRATQSMAVFPTESGFGTSEFDPAGNPLLADTGLQWSYGTPDGPTKRVLFNDLFRAVHDAFGHGLEGAGFRAQGEENAWQAHVRLFTGPAVGAITSETRGQNSWLNFGPYGEKNQTAAVEDTVFADQKTGLMPEWTWTEGRVPDAQLEDADGNLEQTAAGRGAAGGVQRLRAGDLGVVAQYGTGIANSVAVTGVHYSAGPRATLAGSYYGSGLKGAEAGRLAGADPRLSNRIHFYVDTGQGISPEAGVGGYVHAVRLNNLYDAAADPLGFVAAARAAGAGATWFNSAEQAIIDAGFDGVYVPAAQGGQGVAVLLGPQHSSVPVDQFGTHSAAGAAPAAQTSTARRYALSSAEIRQFQENEAQIQAAAPSAQLRNGSLVFDEADSAAIVQVFPGALRQSTAPSGELVVDARDPSIPQVWYRGQVGPTAAEGPFDATAGGRAPSFADSPAVASAYAMNPDAAGLYGLPGAASAQGAGENANVSAFRVQGKLLDIRSLQGGFNTRTGLTPKAVGKILKLLGLRPNDVDIHHAYSAKYGRGANAFFDAAEQGVPDTRKILAAHILADDPAVQAALQAQGYAGMVLDGALSEPGYTDKPWSEAVVHAELRAVQRGSLQSTINRQLYQPARGTFSPEQILITLGETADLSTFLHESGHFFLEVLADLASQPNAPAQIRADMERVLKWFDVPDPATWNAMTLDQKRPHHERWAESFEQYLFEGKSPNQELQPLFRRFRSWMVNVYKSLTHFMRGRNLKLNDEVRQVFDRLLATDEQIARAEEAAGMLPDFEATNEAVEALQARSLRDLKWTVRARGRALKALEKQAAGLRKEVEAEVRAEVEQEPIYKAMRWLKTGETVDDEGTLIKAEKGFRLNTDALAEMYPESMLARPDLAGLRGMTSKTGLHPDMVADMFGFASGDALVREILAAEPIGSVIQAVTDQRMLERHGELATPEALEAAANEAVHNEARARSLATEFRSQAEMMNQRQDTGRTDARGRRITVNAIVEAAKQFGLNLAARRRIKDLKNAAWQHRAAEARASKRWQEATAKGETEAAVQAKRDQLLNNAAAKALQDGQAEVRKTLEFFRRVAKGTDEKIVKGGRDPDVVNAMRAILAAYDVAPRLEKSALAYMETVATNDPVMYAALKPAVDAALFNAKPLQEMTLEELRGLTDELRAMWVLAKRSRQMEVDGNLLDLQDAADELMARMGEIGIPDQVPGEKGAITDKQERGIKLRFALSILSRVEQWAERLDGAYGGPFLRLVFQPVKDAADRFRAARVDFRKRYQALLENVAPILRPGPIAAPELGYTFGNGRDSGAAELMHAILHTGNDSNKRKLLLGGRPGNPWATENADGTLDTSRWDAFIARMINEGKIEKAHYDFAQGVWDLLEQTKPLAQETHRKVFGRYFSEVTANAVVTPFGTYRGGYVPAQTDARLVKDAKLRELAEGENESLAYAFPAAPSGFTKARVEYNKPLMLDLRTLAQHLDKVLLFGHMQGAVTDVRRLLTNKSVSYALDRIDPGAYEGMLLPWLNRAAKQVVETPVVGDRKLSRFLTAARSRAGMALMFANLSNTFQQITGFSLAAVKVKPNLMMKATAQFIADPKAMKTAVAEASPYMKDRMLNEVAAMNDAVEDILVNPTLLERGQTWTQRHAYFMQAAVDNTMSPIIWTAAYNQATAKKMNERDAVRFADGVVRQTQGSTLPEDVSRFETGPGYARLFTQFVSYFNMMANTNATAVSQIANEMGLRKGAGKLLYVALAGLLVPIWVAEAIAQAFRGGPEDEDDDGYLDDWLAAVFGLGTIKGLVAQVPIIGQAAQLVVNRFNDNPADDKFSLSPAVSLIESAVSTPASVYKAIMDEGSAQKAARDAASAATLITGLPIYAAARPLGYLAGMADERIEPTGPVDLVRGLVTGTASPESKVP